MPHKLGGRAVCVERCPHGSGRGKRRESYLSTSRIFNLKKAAKTLVFLKEQGIDSYAELVEKSAAVSAD